MKKCYHCGISFKHDGDPIDGNEFCGHICSGDYIQNIARLSMATGMPPSRVSNLHKNIMASFDKKDKEREELKELRRNIPDHHKFTDEEIRQIHRCSEHYKNLPLGMKADVYRLKPDPRREEEVSRKTGELYHTDPVIRSVVDMELAKNKLVIKAIKEERDHTTLKVLDDCTEWNKRFGEDASKVSIENLEGYYDEHDENCAKEGCGECEEAEAGQAEYEAENAIANQRERWEADQEAIPSDWNKKI